MMIAFPGLEGIIGGQGIEIKALRQSTLLRLRLQIKA
jgi:hypothetical protein